MKALILTRGFAQQFDYNVIEHVKPWGAELHARAAELQARTTSPSDYDFSFVLEGTDSAWRLILNCIPSKRRDFAGSPLRSYLYLSGDKAEAETARRILMLALADFWPGRHSGDNGKLPQCLDDVVTKDVVNALVGWKGTEKIDAQKWSDEKLNQALREAWDQVTPPSLPWEEPTASKSAAGKCVREFLDKAAAMFRGGVGVLTGEYRPYLDDPMKDNPNFVFHFSASDIRTVMPNGTVKAIPKPSPSPFVSRPAHVPPKPEPKRWGTPLKMAMAAVLVILVVSGLRSCLSTPPKAVPTPVAPAAITPQSAETNTPTMMVKETTPVAPAAITPQSAETNTPTATVQKAAP